MTVKKVTKKKVVRKKATKKKTVKEKPEGYVFGRPTKYRKEFCKTVLDACKDGTCFTIASICVLLDIDRDTYYEWKKKYPDFSSSLKKGREYRINNMEQKGFRGINQGKDFNAVPWLFLTKNMFPDLYRDKHEVEVGIEKETRGYAFKLDISPDALEDD